MQKGKFFQFVAAFLAALLVISDGIQYGWTAPLTPLLTSKDSPVQLNENQVYALEAIYMLGGFAGLAVTVPLVNRVGRQRTIFLGDVLSVICWSVIATTRKYSCLLAARFFAGIASDICYVAVPMYIAEIADQEARGRLASLVYISMLIGIFIIYAVGPFVEIWITAVIGIIVVVIQLFTLACMPFTPYYLILKHKPEKAAKSLQFFRSGDISVEFEEIRSAVERQRSEPGKWKYLFKVPSNRKAVLIMFVMNSAQHFSGISVFLMNLHKILDEAGSIYMSPTTNGIVFAGLLLSAAIIGSFLVDRCGRKCLLIFSGVLTCFSILALAVYFHGLNLGYNLQKLSWIPVASVMLYAGVFKLGLGLVPIVLTGELFPAKLKAVGMTMSDSVYVLSSVASIYVFEYTYIPFGMHVTFYIFASCCALAILFTIFYIPETSGKTLEEIQLMLKGNHDD